MLWCTVDVDIEVMVGLGLQKALPHIFMLFRCMSDMNLPAIGSYKLSKTPAVVATVAQVEIWGRRSAVGVAVVMCKGRRRDFVDRGDCRVPFLGIDCTFPWLPVRSWTTIERLPGHFCPEQL